VYDWKNGGTASVEVLNNGKIKSLADLGGQAHRGSARLAVHRTVTRPCTRPTTSRMVASRSTWVPYTSTGEQVDAGHLWPGPPRPSSARPYFESELESNQVKLLLDAADQSQVSAVGVPPGVPEDDIWGIKADLSSKSEAVTRFPCRPGPRRELDPEPHPCADRGVA